jgi:hypothetical protein
MLLWLAGAKQVAPIPEYALQVSAQSEMRSAPAVVEAGEEPVVVRVGRSTRVHLSLRPATGVAGEVAARVYLSSGAALLAWPARQQVAESGALQLVLDPAPAAIAGAQALVVVGRPQLLAARGAELARGELARGAGFQRWRVQLIAADD